MLVYSGGFEGDKLITDHAGDIAVHSYQPETIKAAITGTTSIHGILSKIDQDVRLVSNSLPKSHDSTMQDEHMYGRVRYVAYVARAWRGVGSKQPFSL